MGGLTRGAAMYMFLDAPNKHVLARGREARTDSAWLLRLVARIYLAVDVGA